MGFDNVFGVKHLSVSMNRAEIRDYLHIIDQLWAVWDESPDDNAVSDLLSSNFAPCKNSPLYYLIGQLRQNIQELYLDSEFLNVLYDEGVQPLSLSVTATQFFGKASAIEKRIVLHENSLDDITNRFELSDREDLDAKIKRLYSLVEKIGGGV